MKRASDERAGTRVVGIIIRVLAAGGVVLASLGDGIGLIGGGWCWVNLSYLLFFLVGSGLLLWLRRWEGIAAGALAWLCSVLFFGHGLGLPDNTVDWLVPAGLIAVLVGCVRLAAGWLSGLMWRRGHVVLGTCLALCGAAVFLRPYWMAAHCGMGADLRNAPLAMCDLHGANLKGADLRNANLRYACLDRATLRGANLAGADLRSTCLDGVDLTGADLTGARLTDALFDRNTTRWPAHFDPEEHGAVERVWL